MTAVALPGRPVFSFKYFAAVIRGTALVLLLWHPAASALAQCATATVTNFSVSAPDQASQGTVTIGWDFTPARCCPHLKVHIEGPNFYVDRQLHEYSGQQVFGYDTSCVAPGTYNFVGSVSFQGHLCGVISEKAVQPVTVSEVNSTVAVSLRKLPATGKVEAKVTYDFPPSGPRNLNLYLSSWREDDGDLQSTPQLLGSYTAPQPAGEWLFEFVPPSNARWIQVRATASRCTGVSESFDSLDCLECTAQAGDPVAMIDGTMTFDDADPLPPVPGAAGLRRTYVSSEGAAGAFGRGWFTMFDRMLAVSPSATGEAITMSIDGDAFVTFRGPAGGPYQQVSPRSVNNLGALTYLAGVYEFRPPGGTVVSRYSASGRFIGWRDLTSGRGTAITYDAAGRPQSVVDSWSGVTWTITTDANSRRVTSIAVAGTPSILWEYSYDSDQNLETVKVNGSPWRTYDYVNSRLTEVRDPLGNLIESHAYDAHGRATTSHGPSDEITLIEYDLPAPNAGETLARVTSATGATTDFILKSQGTVWQTSQSSGGCASCGARDSVYTYDREGRVLRAQSASGYVTVFTYGRDGRLAATESPLKPAGCDPSTAANHCRLDVAGLAAALLEPTSATATTTFRRQNPAWPDKITTIVRPSVAVSGESSIQTFNFHPLTGAVTSASLCGWVPNATACTQRTTTTTFYETGSLAPAFDPGGSFQSAWMALPQPVLMTKSTDGPRTDVQDVTSYVYYPADAAVPAFWRGRLAAVRNAAGHITRFENYDVFGNVLQQVDPNGVVVENTFDVLGRSLTSAVKGFAGCDTAVDPLCATDITASRTYEAGTGPLRAEYRRSGGVATYSYDGRGRVQAISRGPAETDLRERIEIDHDPLTGHKSQERTLANDSGTWVEKRRQSFSYDARSRLQTITHADTSTVHYSYDPEDRVATVRDENHAEPNTRYGYDPAGRLAATTQTLAGAPDGVIVTGYSYDVGGNLTSVVDPNGNITTYVYDDFGQMTSQTSPVTGTTTYAYDQSGQLTVVTDANNAVTTRTYDALGRLLTATSSRAGVSDETVTQTYDSASAFGLGRLSQMDDSSGTTTYRYQREGLLASEQRTLGGATYKTSYQYDASGNRTYIGYPFFPGVEYTYDFAGRPLTASLRGIRPLISSASYLPFGPLTELNFGDDFATQRFAYDSRYLPVSNQVLQGVSPLASYAYQHDPAGNITQILDQLNAGYDRSLLQYDDLNRLTGTTTGAELWVASTYTYDRMGNMLSMVQGVENDAPELELGRRVSSQNMLKRRTGFQYSGTTSKLENVVEWGVSRPVTYDAAGNEIASGATRTYSARNLMAKIEDWPEDSLSPHLIEFAYDGRGVRVAETESPADGFDTSSSRYFIYSPELQLLAITPATGPNVWHEPSPRARQIVWFGGRPVAEIPTLFLAPPEDFFFREPEFTFADHLGTPFLQLSDSGIEWRAEYEPFGNIHEMRAGTREGQPLRFPGQEVTLSWEGYEENYNIFRWYRAGWGRYTQADPIGLAGGFNLYAYAADNPVMRIDPLGRLSYNVASPTYTAGTWDQTVSNCDGAYAYGCTKIKGRIDCNCKCSGDDWRASVSINIMSHAVYYATDVPIPGSLIMAEEQKHVDENLVRLNTIRNEGLKIEAKKYPLKILCQAECKIYELWGTTMMMFSGSYTHVTDPHPY